MFAISLKHVPALLILIIVIGITTLAALDPTYRDDFLRLAEVMIAGFWGWMSPQPNPYNKNNDNH